MTPCRRVRWVAIEGMPDGVWVGMVDVGNAPSSAPEVSAGAVLVRFALRNVPTSMLGPRKADQSRAKVR